MKVTRQCSPLVDYMCSSILFLALYRSTLANVYTCRAAEVVKQYPNVMVMLEHCGLPYEKDEPSMKLWKEGVLRNHIHSNYILQAY